MAKFRKNSFGKTIALVIVTVLLSVAIISVIGYASNGKFNYGGDDWSLTQLNPDNYIKVDNYLIENETSEDGYSIEINNDGRIKVTGKNATSDNVSLDVTNVTLPAGTYTFISGAPGVSTSSYFMSLFSSNGEHYADFGGKIVLTEESTFTVKLVIMAGQECDATFSPVLVPDGCSTEFKTLK